MKVAVTLKHIGACAARPASAAHDLHSARRENMPLRTVSDHGGSQTARGNLESAPSQHQPLPHASSSSGSRRASLPAPQRGPVRPATAGRVSTSGTFASGAGERDSDNGSLSSRRSGIHTRNTGWPVRSRSSSRPASAGDATMKRTYSSRTPTDSLTLQIPSELDRTLSGGLSALGSAREHSNGLNLSNSGALQDATNASASHADSQVPSRPRSRASNAPSDSIAGRNTGDGRPDSRGRGAPHAKRPSDIENHFGSGGYRGAHETFLGMGKADEALHLSSQREMSVLQQVWCLTFSCQSSMVFRFCKYIELLLVNDHDKGTVPYDLQTCAEQQTTYECELIEANNIQQQHTRAHVSPC